MATAVYMSNPGAVRDALGSEVLAAGALRQGQAASVAEMAIGLGLWKLFGPRKFKGLPRVFVLAVVGDEVRVYRASGGGTSEDGDERPIKIGEPAGSWPRSAIRIGDLDPEKGVSSKNMSLTVDGETFPVTRSNMAADPNTDELVGLLSGA